MNRARVAAALAIAIAVPSAALAQGTAGQSTTGKSDGTAMRRTTLLTHDIDRSIAFYQAIGYTIWLDGKPGKVGKEHLPVKGVKEGDPSRFAIMKGKDPYLGMVGLLQYGKKRKAPKISLEIGDPILMIETVGVDAIAAKLQAAGMTIHKMPETVRVKSVSAEWDTRTMFVFDPDGHMIELTERLN